MLILHIPHASTVIPEEYLDCFLLDEAGLERELLLMTDHFTDELFDIETTKVVFPVSRLLVDPERFPDDAEEPMSKVGMGVVYSKTHNGKPLKDCSEIRDELIIKYYRFIQRPCDCWVMQAQQEKSIFIKAMAIGETAPKHQPFHSQAEGVNTPAMPANVI